MRSVAIAALVLGACTGIGGGVDPKVVGEYHCRAIVLGESLCLAADGTFVRRGLGNSSLFHTIRGDWALTEGRVVLHATGGEWRGRLLDEAFLASEYPLAFTVRPDGTALVLVKEREHDGRIRGWPALEWTRYEPQTGAR